jgi:hypothetical protein
MHPMAQRIRWDVVYLTGPSSIGGPTSGEFCGLQGLQGLAPARLEGSPLPPLPSHIPVRCRPRPFRDWLQSAKSIYSSCFDRLP